MRIYLPVATRNPVMDCRFGMPNVLMPSTFFLLKVSQALNAFRHFAEARAKLIANDVLVKLKRFLIALGSTQPKSGNLDNAFPNNCREWNRHLGRHDWDSLHDAKPLLFSREDPADDDHVWRFVLCLILLRLSNKALLPSRSVFALVHNPTNNLCAFDYFVQDVGTFNAASDSLNSVVRKRLPKVRKEVEFRF